MGEKTEISWADDTFNPWWGCTHASPGCDNCYAETFAHRIGLRIWGNPKTTPRRTFGQKHWRSPLTWERKALQAGTRRRVFCASMADVFEHHALLETERQKLWPLIEQTPHLDWLLLTKRPQNLRRMLPSTWLAQPLHNVWLGTSVEAQHWADLRIPRLLDVPAVVHFVSAEPLLGPLKLGHHLSSERVNWVIAGGESGHHHRPVNEDWVRGLRDQCRQAGVAFHYKQRGGRTHAAGGRHLDGREWLEIPTIGSAL